MKLGVGSVLEISSLMKTRVSNMIMTDWHSSKVGGGERIEELALVFLRA
jgi:hypothetical protein